MNNRERLVELIEQGRNATDCAYMIDCPVTAAECYNCELNTMVDYLIANGVTAQKHGRWVGGWDMVCSECGSYAEYSYDYCPNCGAKMDGEREENENN